MKSWSLRGKPKESREKDGRRTPSGAPRPHSMGLPFPHSTSHTELSATALTSPSTAYSSRSRTSSLENELIPPHPSSPATAILSTAQRRDKARREKNVPTMSPTSRSPLSSKHNNGSTVSEGRSRVDSLPKLILKGPNAASISTPMASISPAEARIHAPSSEEDEMHHQEDKRKGVIRTERSSFGDSSSVKIRDLKAMPASPSPDSSALHSYSSTSTPGLSPPNGSTAGEPSSRKKATRNSVDHRAGHESAVDSLRRFAGADGISLAERKRFDNVDSMSLTETVPSGKTAESATQSVSDDEQALYSFTIRKKRRAGRSGKLSNEAKSEALAAKYQLVLVRQRVSSITRSQTGRQSARQLIAVPIPAVLRLDAAAVWTVERFSRVSSCIINIFGS